MAFNKNCIIFSFLLVLSVNILSAQESISVGMSGGYRANFSKTSMTDRLTIYPLNYHTYAPGYYFSLKAMKRNFFLRTSFSGYGIIHSHGVYNITIFSYDSPRNKNIRNTHSSNDINLDIGYEFPFYFLNVRLFSGFGSITTGGKEWVTNNMPVQMVVHENVDVTTTLEIFSQAFRSQTYYSNFGFGFSLPIFSKLRCELDIGYQTFFKSLAANSGIYRSLDVDGNGPGGEFSSQLTGAWYMQLGVSYQLKEGREKK